MGGTRGRQCLRRARRAHPLSELRRLGREVIAVSGTRGLSRESLIRNRAIAAIEADVTDGSVTLDGRPLAMEPVAEVPLSRAYLLR